MRWTFLIMFVSSQVTLALADPIPKESDSARLKRVWGEFVDEGGGATVKLDGEKLRMTIPSGDRLVYPMRGGTPTFAPYLFKTAKGDFEAIVTVHRHAAPEVAFADGSGPITGSGLVALFDSQTVVSFCRGTAKDGRLIFRSTLRYRQGSSTTTGSGAAKHVKTETASLRLTRRGDQLQFDYSFDDRKTWQRFSSQQRATNHEVKIGVYAEHACDAITEATFEGFSVKPLPEEKKP